MENQPFSYPKKENQRTGPLEGYDALEELAWNLKWSWNHRADEVWRQLDPDLWSLTHNPVVILQTVSRERLHSALASSDFRNIVEELVKSNRQEDQSSAWFQKCHSHSALSCVAYFSMEFMLSEALPIYSGGLGNVAGDQLRAASDLGVPVIGVGLLYQQGYFRQMIDNDGAQQALYPYNDPGQLPIKPLRMANGEWLRIKIDLPGWSLWMRAWRVKVGRVELYLLDSNDAANFPAHRGITSELYVANPEVRLKQELLLGIGGWRLLNALGIRPEVCHLNEGHAAFGVLERARVFMQENQCSFEVALTATRAGNLFTTHTAVPAGFDRFSPELIDRYLGKYAQEKLGITLENLLALGRARPGDNEEPFNMAYLAIRGSGAVNGVSCLHGQVSRRIFQDLFPHWPREEVPVGYVTNGVHVPSWDSAEADALWTEACGKERWLGDSEIIQRGIREVSDARIWQMRNEARKGLIDFARVRVVRQMEARGAPAELMEKVKHFFDPHALTLGFARRFATYKRPNMLLQDPQRLLRLLTRPNRPVQLIIAGKAHPEDKAGRQMIQDWIRFIRGEGLAHVIFLTDYDMLLTERLVSGVDVWINTPRRPWEACGTSGMKVLVNGGLNLSELDGWWAEAYAPEVGWAIGDAQEHAEEGAWDAAEAAQLYEVLEQQVVPEFYERNDEGIPEAWVAKMRESMGRLTPQFSASRAVREYTERYYLQAAAAYLQRTDDKAALASKMVLWKNSVDACWPKVRFGEAKCQTAEGHHHFAVHVHLDSLVPDEVAVELFAEGIGGKESEHYPMKLVRQLPDCGNFCTYEASVPSSRPPEHYTARIFPCSLGITTPLEVSRILWQR